MRNIKAIGDGINDNTKVYKYFNLDQFISLIENSTTYLTRVSVWDDTWEAPNRNIPIQNDDGKIEYSHYSISSDLFGQCWTLKSESDALWRIYSPNQIGLKIGSSVGKLNNIDEINISIINRVYYYRELLDGLKKSKLLTKEVPDFFGDGLIKRNAFNHEEEVRLLTLNNERYIGDKKTDGNYIEFNIDINELIEEIDIDPRAPEYYVETIKKYCRRAGLSIIPQKSNLYSKDIHDSTRIVTKYIPVKQK